MMPLRRAPSAYCCKAVIRNSAGWPWRTGTSALAGPLPSAPWQRAHAPAPCGLDSTVASFSPLWPGMRTPPSASVSIALRIHGRNLFQEGHDGPDLVFALQRHPTRHARVFDAVLDDPEQLFVLPRPHRCREIGRRRQHVARDRTDGNAGRAVTESAAAVKVARPEPDEVWAVERRRRDRVCAQLHRIAHGKSQEPVDDGPVAAAGGDIEDA